MNLICTSVYQLLEGSCPIIHFPPCCHGDCTHRTLIVNKSVVRSDFCVEQATFHLDNFKASSGIGVCNLQSVICIDVLYWLHSPDFIAVQGGRMTKFGPVTCGWKCYLQLPGHFLKNQSSLPRPSFPYGREMATNETIWISELYHQH